MFSSSTFGIDVELRRGPIADAFKLQLSVMRKLPLPTALQLRYPVYRSG